MTRLHASSGLGLVRAGAAKWVSSVLKEKRQQGLVFLRGQIVAVREQQSHGSSPLMWWFDKPQWTRRHLELSSLF